MADEMNYTVAGALESFCALAHAHLELGVSTPFLVRFRIDSSRSNLMLREYDVHTVYSPSTYSSFISIYTRSLEERGQHADYIRRHAEEPGSDSDRCYRVSGYDIHSLFFYAFCTPDLSSFGTLCSTGNVAKGILDILQDLPIQRVEVKDLPALVSNPGNCPKSNLD